MRIQLINTLIVTVLATTLVCGFCKRAKADSEKLMNSINNHAYQRFDSVKTWTGAKNACESHSSHLATITSQAENDWVWNNLGKSAPVVNTYFGNHRAVWLGGTDMVEEGHWQWVSGETWNYTNWYPGEPENGGGIGEDYTVMFDSPAPQGKWVDAGLPYADLKILYICEWDNLLPPLVHALATSSNTIRLTLEDNSSAEKGFRIQRKDGACSSGNPWVTLADKGASNTRLATFLDSPLMAATPYSYQVSTYYGGGSFSAYSECASAMTAAAGSPHIPTSLRADSKSDSRVDLTWNDVSEIETDFKIYRKAGSGSLTLLDTVAAGIQRYSDRSAAGNSTTTSYRYDVRVCNGSDCSLPNTAAIVPFSPEDLVATAAATVQLNWEDNSSDESGFEIWRKNGACTTENPWVMVHRVAANTQFFNDRGAVESTEYAYKVRAYSVSGIMPQSFGYSLFTGCISVTAP